MHHKWLVFKFCIKAGIPYRGLVHDLSKFSPTEFWESVRYYQGGKRSPVPFAKKDLGYSEAWLHHDGRNKHHYEYWFDHDVGPVVMPYKYAAEMICDKLAAAQTYQGKSWTKESNLEYWNIKEKHKTCIHEKTKAFIEEVMTEVSEKRYRPSYNK